MQIIEGGVTAAKGFKAAGMAAGIKYKNGKKDMASSVILLPYIMVERVSIAKMRPWGVTLLHRTIV